ncbi:diamine oxidase [Mytilus galloprovincialis]|nr:diamine oxidase [Mytilus galloprovincialis]
MVFAGLSLVLLIALIIVASTSNNSESSSKPPVCSNANSKYGKINLDESDNPSVFHHLTEKEIEALTAYLYRQTDLNLILPSRSDLDDSVVYISDIHLPNKQNVLNYLDNNGPKPAREALVILFRGDKNPPYIEEMLVGPLPNPTYHKPVPYRNKIPYIYRPPLSGIESEKAHEYMKSTIDPVLGNMFVELFGGKLTHCGDKCLKFGYYVPMSSAHSGEKSKRRIWMSLVQELEISSHHIVDFSVLLDLNVTEITIKKVWFSGNMFNTLNEALTYFKANKATIAKVPFPNYSKDLFSTLNQRGEAPIDPPLRNPRQVSPDGKRYNVRGRHVEYMSWSFDFRMSLLSGPQIYDVRFRNERIAYEISLQDIGVFYSGYKPHDEVAHFLDSMLLLGNQTKMLFPGIDCPSDATFISSNFIAGGDSIHRQRSSFCLFELNTGMPLRRHHSYWFTDGRFYEGMENVVLILRTIPVVGVYDYMIDFIFYHNGVLEVKITATGYVRTSFYTPGDKKFSYKLQENLAAPLHHHIFNFKADVDIKGTSNRFSTLNFELDNSPNKYSTNSSARLIQHKFSSTLKSTERDAAYRYNFKEPKYLIFYNEQQKNRFGNFKSYRILNRGVSVQMLPEGSGNEPIASWARYQVAVTKYKDSERTSSSIYSTLDIADPVVNFQKFIDDDESIIDQDLVAWISMGNHHIPHTEDLPITPTPAMDASFFLSPYNYFDEDQGITSMNAVRVEPMDRTKKDTTLHIQRYGVKQEVRCVPEDNKYDEVIQNEPSLIIDV